MPGRHLSSPVGHFLSDVAQPTAAERFGHRLRQLRREKAAREERDLDQAEVAEAVGDTQPNLAKMEKGRLPKDIEKVKRYAAYYGVNWIWLLHDEGPKGLEVQAPRPAPTSTAPAVVGQRKAAGRRRPK